MRCALISALKRQYFSGVEDIVGVKENFVKILLWIHEVLY